MKEEKLILVTNDDGYDSKGLAAAVAGRNAERRQCERKSREESFHASFGIFANIAKSAGWPRCRGRCVPAFGTDVSR